MKDLNYFKQALLTHLTKLEKKERELQKSRGYSVGTIREWKGQKYIKGNDSKWRRYYSGESRGAKMAIAAIKRKINNATSEEELMKIILDNSSRFRDEDGNVLPLVLELHKHLKEKQGDIEKNDNQSAVKLLLDEGKIKEGNYKDILKQVKEKGLTTSWQEGTKLRSDKIKIFGKDGFDSKGSKFSIKKIVIEKATFELMKKNTIESYKSFLKTHPQASGEITCMTTELNKVLGDSSTYTSGIISNNIFKHPNRVILVDKIDSPETEEEASKNRSIAMMGNQNAKKEGMTEEEKKQRAKAKMPNPDLFERTSAMEDSTWDPTSEDYRYKDTGYIAGSRKEIATTFIRSRAKSGISISEKEIDWTGLEENPRLAKTLITKSNVFGKVDWGTLKENGMTGGVGFLLDRIYASVGVEPKDNVNSRRNFVIALDGLKDRLEDCKTVEEVTGRIKEIRDEYNGNFLEARKTESYLKEYEIYQSILEKIREKEKINEEMSNNHSILRSAKFKLAKNLATKYFKRSKQKRYEAMDNCDLLIPFLMDDEKKQLKKVLKEHEDAHKAWMDKRVELGYYDKTEATKDLEGWTSFYNFDEQKVLASSKKRLKDIQNIEGVRILLSNPLYSAWESLGKKFSGVLNYGNYRGSDSFAGHVIDSRRGKYDDWEWANKEKIEVNRKNKEQIKFELKVASIMTRKGGRSVNVSSTEELKEQFNLRDVQSGNWVLKDPDSAKFHVDRMAEGLADLADITGIPDNLLSMNGRLAMAIGARGRGNAGWKGAAAAHYEPVERVINITKMRGGGSLGHEWFHSFDNLISESMTGGEINEFLTTPFSKLPKTHRKVLTDYLELRDQFENSEMSKYGEYLISSNLKRLEDKMKTLGIKVPSKDSPDTHVVLVKSAFDNLVQTMKEGNIPIIENIEYTKDDYKKAIYNFETFPNSLATQIKSKGSLDEAINFIHDHFKGKTTVRSFKNKYSWLKITVAYFDGNKNGGIEEIKSDRTSSSFYAESRLLETSSRSYWSKTEEMAARAFSAFIDDKLRTNGRHNDYLAYMTTNNFYADPIFGDQKPFPEGQERVNINAAMEKLFGVVKTQDAIRKSLTFSGYKLEGRSKICGMDISIENKRGGIRSGVDGDGHKWQTKMHNDYGYIRGSIGVDKDHVDCYVNSDMGHNYGEDETNTYIFIIHQNDPITKKYDEDKVMIGWENKQEAKKAYLLQYDRLGFLGDIEKISIVDFKNFIFTERNKGQKITFLKKSHFTVGTIRLKNGKRYIKSEDGLWRSKTQLKKSFDESDHPRGGDGKFSESSTNYNQEELSSLKEALYKDLHSSVDHLVNIEFTKENYELLFPENRVETPLGSVKIGFNQFDKLNAKGNEGRKSLLYPMFKTLKDPSVVIQTSKNNRDALLFLSSYIKDSGKVKTVVSVVVEIDKKNISISTHEKDPRNVLNKIKKPNDVIYKKTSDGLLTGGNENKSLVYKHDNHLGIVLLNFLQKSTKKRKIYIKGEDGFRRVKKCG